MGLFDQDETPSAAPGSDHGDKNRLFETEERFEGDSRHYLKVLGVVALIVVVAGLVIYYVTLPGVGSRVLGPKGLEDAMRSHFLDKQKRTATDITFYLCNGYYWADVDVELRPDIIGNPIYLIPRYRAKAVRVDDTTWEITAEPIKSPEMDVPCNY